MYIFIIREWLVSQCFWTNNQIKNGAASKYEPCISRLSFIDKHDYVLIHVLIFYCTFMQNWAKEMLLTEKNK